MELIEASRSRARVRTMPAGYAGLSVPVLGLGIALQHVSPRLTLLVFALVVGLAILAGAPVLVRPPDDLSPSP